MTQSILRRIVLVFSAIIWLLAFLPYQYFPSFILKKIPDEFRYGDLYRLSNLPNFKKEIIKCPPFKAPIRQNTEIFIIGDSFLEPERLHKEDFGVSALTYTHWKDKKTISLNPENENILIIESVERGIRQQFSKEIDNFRIGNSEKTGIQKSKSYSFEELISSKRLNEKLETLLFNNDIILKFKELKASLNYHIFNRTSKDVVVAANGKYIFTNLDNDAFVELTDNQIEKMVENLNSSVEKYKKLGFNKVIISVIPNKTSILEPNRGKYNHAIERLQNHKDLRVDLIDTYSIFRNNPSKVYDLSDSHWSCEGRNMWLEKAFFLITE